MSEELTEEVIMVSHWLSVCEKTKKKELLYLFLSYICIHQGDAFLLEKKNIEMH